MSKIIGEKSKERKKKKRKEKSVICNLIIRTCIVIEWKKGGKKTGK